MRRLHPPEKHRAIIQRLLSVEAYQPNGPYRGSSDFAGRGETRCERPVRREISGAMNAPLIFDEDNRPDHRRRIIDIDLRCRKCPSCLKARGRLWRIRAQTEIGLCVRTWFTTFTLSPEGHSQMWNRALLRVARRWNSTVEDLTADERFALRHAEVSREFTLYFKRLRKKGYRFRYLLVCEAHKSGLPHYHMLMHDCSAAKPLTHRAIGGDWPWGFYQAKLVPDGEIRAVNYCTKYLMKTAASRVRASAGYGQEPQYPLEGLQPSQCIVSNETCRGAKHTSDATNATDQAERSSGPIRRDPVQKRRGDF